MTRQKTQLQNPTLLRFAALSEFNELEKVVKANKANKVGSMMIAALEHAKTEKECERTKEIVMKAMERYNSKSEFHAIKLSAIGASFNESVAERFACEIGERAKSLGTTVCLDAEEDELHLQEHEVSFKLMKQLNRDLKESDAHACAYKTYQMYRVDMFDQLTKDLEVAKNNGFVLGVKMVRGAYLNIDAKKSNNVLFKKKEETDESFAKGLELVLKRENEPYCKIILATRNRENIKSALGKNVQFAQLLGMDDDVTVELLERGERVAKYFPFGTFSETVPYLWRRTLERAAFSWQLLIKDVIICILFCLFLFVVPAAAVLFAFL